MSQGFGGIYPFVCCHGSYGDLSGLCFTICFSPHLSAAGPKGLDGEVIIYDVDGARVLTLRGKEVDNNEILIHDATGSKRTTLKLKREMAFAKNDSMDLSTSTFQMSNGDGTLVNPAAH